MYCQLLDQTVERLTNTDLKDQITHTSIDIGLTGYIPKAYIPSDARRIEVYRRLAMSSTQEQIDQVVDDLTSAYTAPPELVRRLIVRARIRAASQSLSIRSMSTRGSDIVLLSADPDRVSDVLRGAPVKVSVVGADLAQTNARTAAGEAYSEIYLRPNKPFNSPMALARGILEWITPGG